MSGDHAGAGIAQLGTDPLPLAWLTVANSPKRQQKTLQWRVVPRNFVRKRDFGCSGYRFFDTSHVVWGLRCPWTPGNAFQVVHPHTAAWLVKTWRALHHLQRDENVGDVVERGWLLVADVGRRSIKIHFLVNFESWHQTYYLALENNLSVSGAWCGKMLGESDCQRGGWNRTSPI